MQGKYGVSIRRKPGKRLKTKTRRSGGDDRRGRGKARPLATTEPNELSQMIQRYDGNVSRRPLLAPGRQPCFSQSATRPAK